MSTDFLLGHVQATLVVGKLQFVLHLLFLQVGHRNLKQDPLRIRNNSSSNSNNSNNSNSNNSHSNNSHAHSSSNLTRRTRSICWWESIS